jgi:hypothetical protein
MTGNAEQEKMIAGAAADPSPWFGSRRMTDSIQQIVDEPQSTECGRERELDGRIPAKAKWEMPAKY